MLTFLKLIGTRSIWGTIVLGLLLIIGVEVAAYLSKHNSPNRDDLKLKEVKELFQQISVYQGSEEVDTSLTSKERIAQAGALYRSNASYQELRDFYVKSLASLGWRLEEERVVKDWWSDLGGRELTFRDGEYYVSVQYAGEKAEYGWNYSISVGWREW